MASSVSGDSPAELLQTQRKLAAVGRRLKKMPKNNEDLLALLEEVERVLSDVCQDPPSSTVEKLYPVAMALVDDKLVGNKDPNIKLQLAACYNEFVRLSNPYQAYPDDEQMKECFTFFIFSFKYLCGEPEKAHRIAMKILHTMAEMRTIVILTDLKDTQVLLSVMFRRFFAVVRLNQNPSMIKCMETVMSLAIQNSWEFSMDVLKPILASVEKENKNVAPAAREMGKRVLEKNARKLRHWLKEANEQIPLPVDKYDEIVYHLLSLADAPLRELPFEVANVQRDVDELDDDDVLDCEPLRSIDEPSNVATTTGHDDGNKEDVRVRSKLGRHGETKAMSIAGSNGFSLEMEKNLLADFAKLEIKDNTIMEKDDVKNTAAKGKGSKKKKNKKGSAALEKEKKSRQRSGKELVYMRVKVWWPLDKIFYTGTIVSYDDLTKKHRVLYDDDDEEILDLDAEIWELFHEERILLASRTSSSSASSRGADQDSVFESRQYPTTTTSCPHCYSYC